MEGKWALSHTLLVKMQNGINPGEEDVSISRKIIFTLWPGNSTSKNFISVLSWQKSLGYNQQQN